MSLFLLRRLFRLLRCFLLSGHSVHHLSCRTGPLGRAYLALRAGSLRQTFCLGGGDLGRRRQM